MTIGKIGKMQRLEKCLIIFLKIWTENAAWMVSFNVKLREKYNGKTMILFSTDEFSAPSESQICASCYTSVDGLRVKSSFY